MQLYCAAADAYGNKLSSNTVEVTLTDVLEITSQPYKSCNTYLNRTAKISIKACGRDLTYQWYYKKQGDSYWSRWKGMNTSEISFTAERSLHLAKARCIVTDASNHSVVSGSTEIYLYDTLTISRNPDNISINSGDKAAFAVSASGCNVKYQWYIRKKGAADWTLWKGHTAATAAAISNDSLSGMQVRCRVTDDSGDVLYSQAAIVTLNGKTVLIESPESVTVMSGEKVTFSVKASGAKLSYQWYVKKKGASAWTLWKGHTSASTSAVANDSWNGMKVCCVVRDANGNSVSSAPATVTIGTTASSFAILSHPKSATAKVGNNVRFEVKAQGDELKYQWYFKKSGATSWSLWKGHTTASTSAAVNATWNGMKLRCLVADKYGSKAYTKEAVVTLTDTPIIITSQPKSVSVKTNHLTSFSVSSKGEDLDYQWYYKKKGATAWSVWRIYTTSTIEPPSNNSWDGMQVRCKITDVYDNALYSDIARVTMKNKPINITAQPQNISVKTGKAATFSVKASGEGLKYQWYYKKSYGSWSIWKEYTQDTVRTHSGSTWNGMQVRCLITDKYGNTVYSDIATVTVLPYEEGEFRIIQQPQNVTLYTSDLENYYSGARPRATFYVEAVGTGLRYQWCYFEKDKTERIKWEGQTSAVAYFEVKGWDFTWNGRKIYCVITNGDGEEIHSDLVWVSIIQDN